MAKEDSGKDARGLLGLFISVLALAFSLLLVTATTAFFIGRLSSKTSLLKDQLDNHYTTIRSDVNGLKTDMVELKKEVRNDIGGFRKDINILIQEIRSLGISDPNR